MVTLLLLIGCVPVHGQSCEFCGEWRYSGFEYASRITADCQDIATYFEDANMVIGENFFNHTHSIDNTPKQIRNIDITKAPVDEYENGHLLSDEEKISLHAELTALTRAMKEASNGQSYNKIDNTVYSVNGRDLTVKTSQEDIQRHFNQSIQDSMNEVSIIFPDFSNYPIPAQQVLVEMNFNMGAGQFSEKNWPRLFESIRNEDWATAATECHRFQLQEERNNWARDKFLEAAGQGE